MNGAYNTAKYIKLSSLLPNAEQTRVSMSPRALVLGKKVKVCKKWHTNGANS